MGHHNLGYCWYCSQVKELGDADHVVPRALFAHENQSKFTVPCCRACNTKKSHGETELAVYLLGRKESSTHPAAQHMWPEVESAIAKNLSKVGRAGAAATWQPYFTKNGLYLGHEVIADLGEAARPIVESLRFMIHGLHVMRSGELLPVGTPTEVFIIPPEQYRPILQKYGPKMNSGPFGLGPEQGTVRWAGWVNNDLPHLGIWLVEFFESVLVVGFVGAAFPKPLLEKPGRSRLRGAKKRRAERLEQMGVILSKPDDFLDLLGRNRAKSRRSRLPNELWKL